VRIPDRLTFLRNTDGPVGQSSADPVRHREAAKGVGRQRLCPADIKNARYYPISRSAGRAPAFRCIDRITLPDTREPRKRSTCFETPRASGGPLRYGLTRRSSGKKVPVFGNPLGMCSHVPEDLPSSGSNAACRAKTFKILLEDIARTKNSPPRSRTA